MGSSFTFRIQLRLFRSFVKLKMNLNNNILWSNNNHGRPGFSGITIYLKKNYPIYSKLEHANNRTYGLDRLRINDKVILSFELDHLRPFAFSKNITETVSFQNVNRLAINYKNSLAIVLPIFWVYYKNLPRGIYRLTWACTVYVSETFTL